jgi:RNA polymerase-interacting CarD/CdnL/TRCF family regulator
MAFNVNERVAYPLFGVGRISAIVKKVYDSENDLCYEVIGQHSTLWVPVNEASARGLRRLTRAEDLAELRALLQSAPAPLNPDFRLRQKDVRTQLKLGTLKALCEVVRDLSGLSWSKPLVDYDAEALRKSLEALCQEWAVVERSSPAEANATVLKLLEQARQIHQA